MLKAAYLISGHSRDFSSRYKSFRDNILEPNKDWQIDVFANLWESINGPQTFAANTNRHAHNSSPFNMNLFYDLYNPKLLIVQREEENVKIKEWAEEVKSHEHNPTKLYAILAQFYKVKETWRRVNEIFSLYDYDLVIRARLDVTFDNPWIFSDLDPKFIYVEDEKQGMDWISDKFAVSNPWFMHIYYDFADDIMYLYNQGIRFNSENLLAEYLNRKNMPIKKINGEVRVT